MTKSEARPVIAAVKELFSSSPDGLRRDKTRHSRIKPLGAASAERVVALTLDEPPGETTHWTGVLMAKAAGLSVSSGPTHLAFPWSATASDAPIQAVQRPALRRQKEPDSSA
jgi:hypothetical protein